MTLTLDQIHALSDPQLCEAISDLKEPKPGIGEKTYHEYVYKGKYKDWIPSKYRLSTMECFEWKPINWLETNNWTRLLTELKNNFFCTKVILHDCDEMCFLIGEYRCGHGEVIKDFEMRGDSLSRAVCEAWLYLQEEK